MFFLSWSMIVHPMVWPWVTRDEDLVRNLGLKGRPFNQVRVFPWILACIPFNYIEFSPWDAFSHIRFVSVNGFNPIMKDLVSVRSDLGLVDVHGLGLHGIQKYLGLIRVLGSFSYKDFSKILTKFEFMMGGYRVELKRDFCVSILDKNTISNMETNGRQCVGVNSPICLSITSKDSFTYKENKRIWRTFLVVFFFFSSIISLLKRKIMEGY